MKSTAYLITTPSNIRYLSNFTGSNGFMLLAGRTKYLFTDFRYIERAANTIAPGIKIVNTTKMWHNPEVLKENWEEILQKHNIKEIGIEEDNLTLSRYKRFKKISPRKKWFNCSGKIEKQREQKSDVEISYITKSQRINERIFEELRRHIKSSLRKKVKIREIDLVFKIKMLAHEFGAEDLAFSPIIAFGPHSSSPHHLPDNTTLKPGDNILIDMGVKYRGYCSDMTRVLFTASLSSRQSEIYELVLKAQTEAIKKIRAGISGKTADDYSRKIIQKAGYGDQYGHAGGHGVGLDIHESPSVSEYYKEKFKKNAVITVEPGIYLEGEFGIRIEDMILLTKSGNKNLTKTPKSQDVMLVRS
ncbi:M24 family metallopeptidase [Candidatus Peregrinibacteria bacterium]|nr:M24 family metallopeptidase [Candidatus Peregrinibacteria bacterium]